MKSFLFLVSFFFNTASTDIKHVRSLYHKAVHSESSANELVSYLENTSVNEPLLYAYKGSALCLKAKYAYNPYSKVSYLNQGLEMIHDAVAANNTNLEIRYLRLAVEMNVPSFLNMNQHLEDDKTTITQGIISGKHGLEPEVLKSIADFMLKNANLDALTHQKVKKAAAL